ncbi:hypothetical protein JTB14_026955 [Gonioctena quinquepunctata]|nr:hypothetical protein JTB14_026955 [Gonioctena quinquepunctata]
MCQAYKEFEQSKGRSVFRMASFTNKNVSEDKDKVKEAETRISAYFVEHNISFNSADHLVQLIKSVAPVADKITCYRTKCSAFANNGIGRYASETLVKKFSLLVDESIDRSCTKHLALVVRTCGISVSVQDEFLALLPVTQATATILHEVIVEFFTQKSIPYRRNMIGFCSDVPNVMMGIHH